MAAVLACGRGRADPHERTVLSRSGAALSHHSAAALWQLLRPMDAPVEISVPRTTGLARRNGIKLHRTPSLTAAAVTSHHRIPVTTPARTIVDLRRSSSPEDVRRAIRQADVLGLRTGSHTAPDPTRSELERRFLRLCRESGFAAPEVNVRIGSFLVDFLWSERRLVVETDGYRYHRGRTTFEDDRHRDLKLKALGYEVVRLTYRQITEESGQWLPCLGG